MLCKANQEEHLHCLRTLQALSRLLLTLDGAFAAGSATAKPPLTPIDK